MHTLTRRVASVFALLPCFVLAGHVPIAAASEPPVADVQPKAVVEVETTSAAERLALAKDLIDPKVVASQLENPITLSVRNPWIDDHTFLYFSSVSSYVPYTAKTTVLHQQYRGTVTGYFRSAAKHLYAVDCVMSSDYSRSEKLEVKVDSGPFEGGTMKSIFEAKIKIKFKRNSYNSEIDHGHVRFVIQPPGARSIRFVLKNPDSEPNDWDFHRCEITPVAMP